MPTSTPTPIPTNTPTATPTTIVGCPSSTLANGVLTINKNCLNAWYWAFNPDADPYYHLHTQQPAGDLFVGLERYTVYGPDWTGQPGTFPLFCGQPWRMCMYVDIGAGPQTPTGDGHDRAVDRQQL